MAYQVNKREFERLVEEAIAEIPDAFAAFLDEVPIEIHTRPSVKLLRELGLEDDELLMGLYRGRARTERSVEDSGRLPDVIYIFQEDHELVAENRADLVREVRTTVLHEIGHHFGMSEDDLEKLGYA
jgi:predicted Zn-dependent protease with MMP-like domain